MASPHHLVREARDGSTGDEPLVRDGPAWLKDVLEYLRLSTTLQQQTSGQI
jgi:hypothetical protein